MNVLLWGEKMLRPYNYDLRNKAVETIMEVSQLLNVSYQTVQKWLRQGSETGDVHPKEGYQKGHRHKHFSGLRINGRWLLASV
ncbi:MAG: hypothetical protein RMI89_07830 [Gloeomargarita sp. SKYBB_i_bin120]|nr:hypothetical protein [Gloeomargarita sp. SKYG98]MCS7292867.1 hypothetical protein [Gloeomargarita sp. SKYB120]MDW8178430.1 hypothetical protein [Gloeomargarita sp. SKYBB_i_bin120]